MTTRHRLFIDLDEAGNPEQAWIERWVDGEAVRGWPVEFEPFWMPDEVMAHMASTIDVQMRLL